MRPLEVATGPPFLSPMQCGLFGSVICALLIGSVLRVFRQFVLLGTDTARLSVGAHTLKVDYLGDSTHAPSPRERWYNAFYTHIVNETLGEYPHDNHYR
jgi:hypothetical protein